MSLYKLSSVMLEACVSVVNKTFKEGPASLSVRFMLGPGVGWFPFLIDCNSVFCVT